MAHIRRQHRRMMRDLANGDCPVLFLDEVAEPPAPKGEFDEFITVVNRKQTF